ncbi:MAG: hypothetical protein HY741_23115 [Chloroflexi bacterium]|nr:hypothetical protein [Chloroflexota bacterium]
MVGASGRASWTSKKFIITVLFASALFVGAYLAWSTWISPRPTVNETSTTTTQSVSTAPAMTPNPTIIPAQVNKDGIPEKLAVFALTNSVLGKDALAEFEKLHGQGFDLVGGYRADYVSGDKSATLWVGQAKDAASAEQMTKTMAGKIGADNRMFTDLQELEIGSRRMYSVNGQGQQHFFYATGDKVVWLAIDSAYAPDALHSLWGAVK